MFLLFKIILHPSTVNISPISSAIPLEHVSVLNQEWKKYLLLGFKVSKDVWRNPKPIRVFIFDQFNNSFPLPWLSSYIHCTMQWVSLGTFLTILRLARASYIFYPLLPPEIFSGVEFILYVCPTVQPSQVSQSPDESGLGNQLSSQPMRSQENLSPLAKESFCKSTDNQHWECRLTETNISLCPLAQHWNLWTGTLPFVKWTLQNLKLLSWLSQR